MRQRFRRSMARRPGEDDRFTLSPRALRIGGWLAALAIVLLIALVLKLLGGNGDGSAVLPSPSGTAGAELLPIEFGTSLDEQRQVPEAARIARFVRGDTVAYSVEGDDATATEIFVEVQRTGGGTIETVQQPTGSQPLPNAPSALIGFTVPAATLLDAFGAGTYLMRIYLDPGGVAVAQGSFELVEPLPSALGSP